MTTSEAKTTPAFAIWMTGLPGSGKSTITRALVAQLREQGVNPVVLESDALRRVLTPKPTYSEEERDMFYGAMLHIGRLFVEHGVPVVFDATANRRRYRDAARGAIHRFIEVYISTPVELCSKRDPKGLYRKANEGHGDPQPSTLPGIGAIYEAPPNAEILIDTQTTDSTTAARRIVSALDQRHWLDDQ